MGILGSRGSSPAPPATPAAAPGLLVWGRLDAGGPVLEPAFDVTAPATVPTEDGPFRVRGLDSDGRTLFSVSFQGDELPEEVGGGAQFAFVVPTSSFDRASLASMVLDGPWRKRGAISTSACPGRRGPGDLGGSERCRCRRAPVGRCSLPHGVGQRRDHRTHRVVRTRRRDDSSRCPRRPGCAALGRSVDRAHPADAALIGRLTAAPVGSADRPPASGLTSTSSGPFFLGPTGFAFQPRRFAR